jgi:hypothetical protein
MRNYKLGLLGVFFVTFSYCSLVFYWIDLVKSASKQITRLDDSPRSSRSAKNIITHNYDVVESEPNEWIFNGNVLQYSTVAPINPIKQYEIEAIIISKEGNFDMVSFLECFLHINSTQSIKKLVMYNVNVIAKRLFEIFKVKCVIENSDYLAINGQISVSVVDSRIYNEKQQSSLKNSTKQQTLFAHRVKLHPAGKAKEKSIVNCVHMLRNVDEPRFLRILNWIEINKAFGMAKIKFYTIDSENPYLSKIKSKYRKLVEVHYYKMKIEHICVSMIKRGITNCVENYGYFFDEQFFNYHERIATNACYMTARLTYEFFTNLDIDELIFPRSMATDYHETIECSTPDCKQECAEPPRNKNETAYSLYNYTMQLVQTHGPKVAYFQFSHFLFLNEFDYFFQQMSKSLSGKLASLEYNNENTRIEYELNSEPDFLYLKMLLKLRNLTNCLNETFLSKRMDVLNYQWTYSLATIFNNREG